MRAFLFVSPFDDLLEPIKFLISTLTTLTLPRSDTGNNLNLIQPVNPWMGNQWSAYTEWFQWQPERNSNSDSFSVNPGEVLHGVMEFINGTDSYKVSQTSITTGRSSSQIVKVLPRQDYSILYIVYEKLWDCDQYPAEGIVTFFDLYVEMDNKPVQPQWTAAVKDSNCDMTAHVINATTVSITWNPKGVRILPKSHDLSLHPKHHY